MVNIKSMFANLTDRLSNVFDRLRGRGVLSEDDVKEAMREVRIALLEADVALPVVKDFIHNVTVAAVGHDVLKSITPGQMVVKIVYDELVKTLGRDVVELNLAAVSPATILMLGLQGSGKTTSTAKLGHFLQTKRRKKVLMASVDIYRPAAQQQLAILGQQAHIDTLDIIAGELPLQIADRAMDKARRGGYDILIIDTAGRLHIDDTLMSELKTLKEKIKPIESLLVADTMIGQDAITMAQSFHTQISITGIILTRVDGDARGGAALSMRAVTQCPIKFLGTGERINEWEEFDPERIASRILDKGDIVALVEKATEAFTSDEAEKMAKKMQKGIFDLDDFAIQLQQISKIGGFTSLLGMLPGMGKMKEQIKSSGINDKSLIHQLAIIRSMTMQERRNPKILNGSRRRRIAQGSGRAVHEVNKLLKQHQDMAQAMKRMNQLGEKGLARQGMGALFSQRK